MSQYEPLYDSFAQGSRFVPNNRMNVSYGVFLPGGDMDMMTGQLKPDYQRRCRTQGKRLEMERLEREEKVLQESLNREMQKGGVRISRRLGIFLIALLLFTCGLCVLVQQSTIVQRQKDINRLERSIADIETINAKVRDNLNREKAEEDARTYQQQYDSLTAEIEQLREDKRALLDGAKLPMEGLGVADGALTYHGQKWDNMSGSEQLRVATAIVRCLKPQCGFVLLDKLEQMDLGTLREFGAWLESEGLQAIATRVSTGDECSIIIEDGYVQGEEQPLPDEPQNTWKAGAF